MNQKATKITNIGEKGKKLAILKHFFPPPFQLLQRIKIIHI